MVDAVDHQEKIDGQFRACESRKKLKSLGPSASFNVDPVEACHRNVLSCRTDDTVVWPAGKLVFDIFLDQMD